MTEQQLNQYIAGLEAAIIVFTQGAVDNEDNHEAHRAIVATLVTIHSLIVQITTVKDILFS